jgi:hypothetical protein
MVSTASLHPRASMMAWWLVHACTCMRVASNAFSVQRFSKWCDAAPAVWLPHVQVGTQYGRRGHGKGPVREPGRGVDAAGCSGVAQKILGMCDGFLHSVTMAAATVVTVSYHPTIVCADADPGGHHSSRRRVHRHAGDVANAARRCTRENSRQLDHAGGVGRWHLACAAGCDHGEQYWDAAKPGEHLEW